MFIYKRGDQNFFFLIPPWIVVYFFTIVITKLAKNSAFQDLMVAQSSLTLFSMS